MTSNSSKAKILADTAAWLEVFLKEELTTVRRVYLFGSVSKIPDEVDLFCCPELVYSFGETTDYDFAVQYSADTLGELISKGWEQRPELSYQDKSTVHVFQKELFGQKVQISLREDLDQFREIWASVPKLFYWDFLNKRSPSYIGREGVQAYIDQLVDLTKGIWRVKPAVRYTGSQETTSWEVRARPNYDPAAVQGVAVAVQGAWV